MWLELTDGEWDVLTAMARGLGCPPALRNLLAALARRRLVRGYSGPPMPGFSGTYILTSAGISAASHRLGWVWSGGDDCTGELVFDNGNPPVMAKADPAPPAEGLLERRVREARQAVLDAHEEGYAAADIAIALALPLTKVKEIIG